MFHSAHPQSFNLFIGSNSFHQGKHGSYPAKRGRLQLSIDEASSGSMSVVPVLAAKMDGGRPTFKAIPVAVYSGTYCFICIYIYRLYYHTLLRYRMSNPLRYIIILKMYLIRVSGVHLQIFPCGLEMTGLVSCSGFGFCAMKSSQVLPERDGRYGKR